MTLALAACGGGGDAADDSAAFKDTAAVAPAPAMADTAATSSSGMLDPDAVTRDQLTAIPGITPAIADSLVARRPFANMLAVDSVLARARLTEQQRDTIYTRLWKPIDLNSASREEILLIPGVGPRMQHEFEEYRPYDGIEKFRREIGKYVDEAEVARLERYVRVGQ
jgi:predicted flap endonuclease-1-like 5' DNA nuclease